MEGFYKVPTKDMEKLIDYYRGELTDNSQLTKAAKLAAKKNLWLASGLPPAMINANIKPMTPELGHLTKRLKEGPAAGTGIPSEELPEKIIKGSPKTPRLTIPKTKGTKTRRLLPTRSDETNPKPKKRKRETEVEKLQPRPGWEEWGTGRKLKRQLEYNNE